MVLMLIPFLDKTDIFNHCVLFCLIIKCKYFRALKDILYIIVNLLNSHSLLLNPYSKIKFYQEGKDLTL